MRTRSQVGVDDTTEEDYYEELIPPPRQPPPPPSPPQRRQYSITSEQIMQQQQEEEQQLEEDEHQDLLQQHQHQDYQQIRRRRRSPSPDDRSTIQEEQRENSNRIRNNDQNDDWILYIRVPSRLLMRSKNNIISSIRKIHVQSNMSLSTLSLCIQQGIGLDYEIAGLFDENSETFHSLQYILDYGNDRRSHKNQTTTTKTLYAVELEPKPPLPPPWWKTILPKLIKYIILPLIVIWILYNHTETTVLVIRDTIINIYYITIEIPLQELYRYGPKILGFWEGETLQRICSYITYQGDENFWIRNMEECQRIYNTKLNAYMYIARPIIHILLFIIFIIIFKSFFWKQQYHHQPTREEREMIDLYRSFHIIIQQMQQRTFHNQQQNNIYNRAEQQQQQRQQQYQRR